jgi:hypothetical protein
VWFLLVLVLIVALLTQRSTQVRAAIIVVLLCVLGTGIYFRLQTPPTVAVQNDRNAPGGDVQTIPLDAIQVSRLEMTGTGAPWKVTGTVTNQSSRELLSFTLAVTRLDCYAGALDASGCVTLWQGEQLVSLGVPANSTRNFAVSIWPHNAIAPKGESRDTFEIKRASGR